MREKGKGSLTTKLLHKHDNLRRNKRIPVPPNRKQLLDTRRPRRRVLGLEQRIGVEDVARGLQPLEAQPAHAAVGLDVAALAHAPAGGLGDGPDEAGAEESGEGGGGEHEAPAEAGDAAEVGDFVEGQVGGVAELWGSVWGLL